jgi:c-di-GMP-binding flagellar brake protein YcgR
MANNNNSWDYQSPFETIQSVQRIASVLGQAAGKQSELRVTLPRSGLHFTTTLTAILPREGHLLVQKLSNENGHKDLLESHRLQFQYTQNGIDLSFTSEYIATVNKAGNLQYKIRYPQSIKYLQRRTYHRMHISEKTAVTATFSVSEDSFVDGTLKDISAGGMRVQFTQIDPMVLNSSGKLLKCVIKLPDATNIECAFDVRHTAPNKRQQSCTVGGSFRDLEITHQRIIERFVASLDRKSRRDLNM